MKQQEAFPFQNQLTREEARARAQELANEADRACIIYKEGLKVFGVELGPKASDCQLGASVECVYPEEG